MPKRTLSPTWIAYDPHADQAPPPKRAGRRLAKPPDAPYKATVKVLAEAEDAKHDSRAANVDEVIIERIKKCLARANHPGSPQAEAKAAVYLASRLMKQYNVSQMEILAHESSNERKRYAGQSIVSIKRADGSLTVVPHRGFLDSLSRAMCIFFDCKCYSTQMIWSLDWTFYGIAQNTVAAAMAFEMAHNLILEWGRYKKGVRVKNSYLLGLSAGLEEMARRERKKEEEEVREAERQETTARVREEELRRQTEEDRLTLLPENEDLGSVGESPEPVQEWEDGFHTSEDESEEHHDEIEPDFKEEEEEALDPCGDLDEEIEKYIKREPLSPQPDRSGEGERIDHSRTSPATLPSAPEASWTSTMQLAKFRATATKIADDYLADKGTKLRTHSYRAAGPTDYGAYHQGKVDSRNIDVHRRRLE